MPRTSPAAVRGRSGVAGFSCQLALTPAGHLLLREFVSEDPTPAGGWVRRVSAAFTESRAAGLVALAAARPDGPAHPSFFFWRDLACDYLGRLCRTPDLGEGPPEAVEPPSEAEIASLLLAVPPMEGAEYLCAATLRETWSELDEWVRSRVAAFKKGLAGWLAKHAPGWHQVGRVCFHLAENKRDPELPFAFLATYAPRLSKRGRVQYRPLGRALEEYAGARNRKALISLLSPVQRAAEKVEFVKELVDSGEVFHPLAWSPREAYRLLRSAPLLEESGLLVRLPDWWRKRPRPRVAVNLGEKKKSRFGVDAMLDFRVGVALDGEELDEEELRSLLAAEDGLALVRGRWVEVDHGKLSQALEHWKQVERAAAGDGLSFIEGMRLLAGAPADLGAGDDQADTEREWSFVSAGSWLSEVLEGLRDPEGLADARVSRGFRGELRPYQETGHRWLRFLSGLGLGACLADDMGLGKTIQVISLLLSLKEEGAAGSTAARPSLLVLPASLLSNWKAEIERFAPDLDARYLHPSETDRRTLAAVAADPAGRLAGADLVLTTYSMLLRQKWLKELQWRLVILDEAQAIKNPAARQTKAAKALEAGARIALTGTPVENRLSDLWSLFDFLCPGLLGSAQRFRQFVKGLEKREHDRYAPLRGLVGPYILRRLKTDRSIIADLPEKTEVKAFCGLAKRQAAAYAAAVEELSRALESTAGIRRRGLVLAYLMRFKQICNHPDQFSGDGDYEPDESGKFGRLRAICEEVASRGEKALVFTQFREMTGPLAAFLAGVFGREGLVLHGGTPVGRRRRLVESFGREDGPPFFVLSLKAGGTGLNLTAASHVIHFDRWWNPAVEQQATDRAFRIGQQRNVLVHKFVCRGTVEEKIDALIEEKTGLAEDLLKGGAEAALTEMSDAELLAAVTLDVERARV